MARKLQVFDPTSVPEIITITRITRHSTELNYLASCMPAASFCWHAWPVFRITGSFWTNFIKLAEQNTTAILRCSVCLLMQTMTSDMTHAIYRSDWWRHTHGPRKLVFIVSCRWCLYIISSDADLPPTRQTVQSRPLTSDKLVASRRLSV